MKPRCLRWWACTYVPGFSLVVFSTIFGPLFFVGEILFVVWLVGALFGPRFLLILANHKRARIKA